MKQIKAALARLIQNYGLEVTSDDQGLALWWSLYTQGSGVCFDAELTDLKPVHDVLFADGRLDVAIHAKDLIENHELKVKVKRTDHRYTHANTMDVETSGPTSNGQDPESDGVVVEELQDAVKDLVERASKEAEQLLEDFYMIHVSTKEPIATHTSGDIRVVTEIAPADPGLLDWSLDGGDDEDALEAMRYLAGSWREQAFGELKASVFVRVKAPTEHWHAICEESLIGVWQRGWDLRRAAFDVAQDAIATARQMAEHRKPNQLQEAA